MRGLVGAGHWLRAALALVWAAGCALAQAQPSTLRIEHFDLTLRPSLQSSSFTGTLSLQLTALADGAAALRLDAGALEILAAQSGGQPLRFERQGSSLHILMPAALRAGQAFGVMLQYTGKPGAGLRMDLAHRQISTAFSTSQWMPCLDDPSVRATFDLALLLPDDLSAIANGEPTAAEPTSAGERRHRWRLAQPMPSYLYGFAAAPFRRVEIEAGGKALQFAGPERFSEAQLRQVFAGTPDMMAFYADRSGIPYPLQSYGQVLLHDPAAQEMAGFSVMGERYGDRVLDDPQSVWLGAHELAHQWWGNGLTNRAWTHFWLNEGIASFMTAAYIEHRFGRAPYLELMALTRTKYEALRASGLDKPLVFPDWDHPTSADRSLVYDKGALVLHELRTELGEDVFWAAIRHYTRKHWGQSVDTADFERAVEESSGRNLSAFFRQWVGYYWRAAKAAD